MRWFVSAGVAWAILIIIGAIGWILNIVKVIDMSSATDHVSTLFVFRCIGIFLAPLGAILGLFV